MNIRRVKDIFEENLESQIIGSDFQSCNIGTLLTKVEKWKKDGYTIVFTAGVFDIFTINHLVALYHYRLLGGKRSKLIVSIDTDDRVKQSKSFIEDKGNSVKPILSWKSRALMVAKQSFRNKENLVDAIVQHGLDTCADIRCPHDDNVTIAEAISPDIVVVTSTSIDTIKKIKNSTIIDTENMRIINEEALAYQDYLIGGTISTSAIIKRVKYGL